MIAFLLILFKN